MTRGAIQGKWAIGPFIGIARVGNSETSFYLEPDATGALPIEVDDKSNLARRTDGIYDRVTKFKDEEQRIRRQAARFQIFHQEGERWRPVHDADGIREVEWTVHLANKKACWFEFSELRGDTMYLDNKYDNPKRSAAVPRRNAKVVGDDRRSLIIDFGPRTVSDAKLTAEFRSDKPVPEVKHGHRVDFLGELRMNAQHELLVLGGHGKAGGNETIKNFAGADGWHDDIADGPVTCKFKTRGGDDIVLQGWVIVGSPKYAPEIVNIVTLADVMEDVAIREVTKKGEPDAKPYRSEVYDRDAKQFRAGHKADFDRDVRPILERPGAYRWVAHIPALQSVSLAPLDNLLDNSKGTPAARLRRTLFQLYRQPNPHRSIEASSNKLFPEHAPEGVANFPAMPLNSGSNSVSNDEGLIDKFLSLTPTQHFMLSRWAVGEFEHKEPPSEETPWSLTLGSLGNCVGSPLCPGIEVAWSVRNPKIYFDACQILHREKIGRELDPDRDETTPAPGDEGCEPGDLTKRMAIPWQADFFSCSTQNINYSDAGTNTNDGIPPPPTYYAHWWPPQSPWQVITGDVSGEEQVDAGTPAGMPVQFTRGINSFDQMLLGWSYLGFIVNQTEGQLKNLFPNFTEQERHHKRFVAASTAIGASADVTGGGNATFNGSWILRDSLDNPGRAPVTAFPTSRRRGRKPNAQ